MFDYGEIKYENTSEMKEVIEVEGGREPEICTTKVLGRNLYKQVIDV